DLIIPSDVEKVGDYAFSGYRALKSVTIEKGVKSVGRSAFYACSNLKTADLGKEISDIGTEAFGACEGLRKVVIGDGLEYIREYTFSSLLFDEIIIGKDVKVIAENAFSAGANVKNLYFDGDLKDWLNITIENNNGNFLINTENFYVNGSLVENVVIPAEITTVSNNLGYCKNLKTVVIEDGAQKLGDYAFWKCENLESVVIPETVTEIGAYAFSGCKNLGGISLPSTLTKISEGLLSDCAAIENVAIPTTATIIEKQAFANMMSLKEIVVPNAVTKIGDDAFHSCTSLASVSLSENLTRIGEGSFYNCNSLFEITLPDGLESIGYQAFYCCRNIRKIVIPDSVTTVGTYAFSGMTKLNGVTVGKNVAVLCSFDSEAIIEVYNRSSLDVTEEVQTSWGMQKKYGTLGYAKHVYAEGESYLRAEGDYTFYDDGKDVFLVDYKGSEKEVILPSGYKGRNYTVHDYAFYYDLDLVSVTIPDGVTAINGAFRDCENLERAYIGDTVQTIGIGCFYGCKKLKFVSAGGGLKEIGLSAFAECENLTELEFSDGLEVIKSFAFEKCVGLISLILPTSVKSVGSYALSQVSRYIDVYYKGGVSDFEKVDADEYFDWSAHIRYYSETQPSTDTTLIFWHYDEDGKIVFW
ncbi:MAG: leucine-rich repeat domain-containing protein, partial [Clostridia bacterium]|nr:leucine-rich repeat domain-containing protein [Clostridia bacterium]